MGGQTSSLACLNRHVTCLAMIRLWCSWCSTWSHHLRQLMCLLSLQAHLAIWTRTDMPGLSWLTPAAGAVRQAWQLHTPGREGLLHPAAQPEAAGGGPFARPYPRGTPSHCSTAPLPQSCMPDGAVVRTSLADRAAAANAPAFEGSTCGAALYPAARQISLGTSAVIEAFSSKRRQL